MDLTGAKVIHKSFGDGIIQEHAGTLVHVAFNSTPEIKKFQYPASFGTFLTLVDEELTQGVSQERIEIEQREEEKKRAERLEQERKMVEQQLREDRNSTGKKTVNVRPFSSVDGFCDKFSSEISKEVYHLRSNTVNKYKAFDGASLGYANGTHIYSFETETELYIPDGTQITLVSVNGNPTATIGSCEEFTMIITTPKNLDNDLSEIEFTVEFWQLLTSLNDRLSNMKEAHSSIAKSLISDGEKAISASENISKGSDMAIHLSQSQPIVFIHSG